MTIFDATSPAMPVPPPPEDVPTRILSAERCHLGEGPLYEPESDTAWWFDILGRRLYESRIGIGEVVAHELPVMASALAVVDAERHLLVAEDGLYLRSRRDGTLQRHASVPTANAGLRSNDARVHPSGTLWFSTMGRGAQNGAGAIHALQGDGITTLFTGITIPNAICFSPTGDRGYYADTAANLLMQVRLDPASGLPTAAPEPLLRHVGTGGLDGAVTDARGLIWCAHWGAGRIVCYTPAGEAVRSIRVPAVQASCPAFVGPGLTALLVTSAYEDMDEKARSEDPHHGRTFILDVGADGRPEPRVKLGERA